MEINLVVETPQPGQQFRNIMIETKNGPADVATIWSPNCDADATARLFAAAPELFDAALAVIELRNDLDQHDRVLFLDDGIAKLRTAIAKAKGEHSNGRL